MFFIMKRRFVHIFLFIAAIQCLFGTMAAFAVSSPNGPSVQTVAADEVFTGYIQFSGCGRWVLSESGDGTADATLVSASVASPSDDGLKWTLTVTEGKAILQSARGRYLQYADGAISTTTDASQATSFTWSVNTYYKDVNERRQLLLPGQNEQAIGVRGGRLTVVKANSRYAVVYTASEVHGADLPDFSDKFISHYYNVGTIWGNDQTLKDYLGATQENVRPGNALTNDDFRWKVLEENELGDIVLQSRSGYYLMQNDKSNPIKRTTSADDAAVFELVEGTDLGNVMWRSKPLGSLQWYDYWQLRNKNITDETWYFFEGNENRYGDSGNPLPNQTYGDKTNFGKYSYAANRVVFKDAGIIEATQYYLQFTGNGRAILTEDGQGGASVTVVDAATPSPNGSGQKWAVNLSSDGKSATFQSNANRYLHYDASTGQLTTSTSSADATAFGWSENTYYTELTNRYQLLVPGQTTQAIGVRGGKLAVVNANSRHAVLALTTIVEGADMPETSTPERVVYYYIQPVWGANAADKDRLYADLTKSPALDAAATKDDKGNATSLDYKSDPYRWMLEEVNGQGDVRLRTRGGLYLMQADANSTYSVTDNEDEAAVFQLVEAVGQGQVWWQTANKTNNPNGAYVSGQYWSSFWQLKNTANGYYFFEGNDHGFGGLNNTNHKYDYAKVDNYAQYLYAFNRLRFERSELDPESEVPTFSYIQFAGTGRNVLCADTRTGKVGVEEVTEENNEFPSTQGNIYKYNLLRSGSKHLLHTEDNHYLAYDEVQGFHLTADKDEAYAFLRTPSTYYNETGLVRYNLESASLTGKALGVVDGTLQWTSANTRFTASILTDAVKGQDFPELSSEYDHWWYQVQMWYGDEGDDKTNYLYTKPDAPRLTVNGTKPADSSLAHLWSFELANDKGDVLVKNKSGLYMYQPASGKAFDYTDDRSKATVMRLMEYVDGGQVTFNDNNGELSAPANHTWDRFWQFKAVDNNSYLYVAWKNFLGTSEGTGNGMNYPGQNGFAFANNRSRFVLKAHEKVDLDALHGYLQFSGQGRTVLVQDENSTEVKALFMEGANDSVPAGKGYQWTLKHLGNTEFKLHNAWGKYLKVSTGDGSSAATFTVTDSEDEATELTLSSNAYYGREGIQRFNLLLASDHTKALGATYDDEGAHLALVSPDSRGSVIRWSDVVRGPKPFSYLDESAKVFNLPFHYYRMETDGLHQSVNYVQVSLSQGKLYTATAEGEKKSMSALWRVGKANAEGDIYLVSFDGYYITLNGSNYNFTKDASKKAVFRPVECSDPHLGSFWTPYWQLRDTSTGYYMFVGYDYTYGGQGNSIKDANKGQYGYANNRMEFEEAALPEGYFLFSAFGPYPLSDNQGQRISIHAAHEKNDDKGAIWQVVPSSEGLVALKSGNGNYIAWNAGSGFHLTQDVAEAYPFTLNASNYQHNNVSRYLFCSTDGTKALRASNNGTEGVLDWTADGEEMDTRFTSVHIYGMVTGPSLPDANGRGTTLRLYRIVTTGALSTPNGTYFNTSTQREETLWTSGAHYYYNEQLDRSNADADQKVTLSVLPDMDYTGIGEEANVQKYSGEYWVVERVMDDWTYDGVTYKGKVGDYYIRSYEDNRYLAYDATAKRFVTTADKAKAAVVRLIEDDNDFTSWQLQLVNSPDKTNDIIAFAYDEDATTHKTTGIYLALAAPGLNRNYVHFNYVDIHAECYDDTSGAYRSLQFINEAGTPYISVDATDATKATANASTVDKSSCWKFVGDNTGNFVLVNPNGKYMAWKDGQMVMVDKKADATHFCFMQNTNKSTEYITWCLCPLDADGKLPETPLCVQRKADGTLTLVDYRSNCGNTDTGIYFSSRLTPRFSDDDHAYFHYIRVKSDGKDSDGNAVWYYLNGNVDGGFLVNGTASKEMNYQTSNVGKVEFLNKQLWAFVRSPKADGTADYLIMTRDNTYLTWAKAESEEINPAHFSTTVNKDEAAHFQLYLHPEDAEGTQYIVEYIPTADDVVGENRYLAFRYSTDVKRWLLTLQSTQECTVDVEEWSVADAEDYSAYKILHKRSWFVKEVSGETGSTMAGFIQPDEAVSEGWETNPYTNEQMQKTNVYTVHHYFKDGSNGFLHLPTYMKKGGNATATASYVTMYERFYDYQTGQDIDPLRVILKRRSRRSYQNGTIMGRKLYLNNYFGAFVGEGFTFQMPPLSPTDYRYMVAVDASSYSDFVDYFGDSGVVPFTDNMYGANSVTVPNNQDLVEPTLSARYIYVIHNAREMADRMELCAEGAGNEDHWLEEHTIAFPKKKVGFKNSTLPLDYQMRDYWFYNTATRSRGSIEDQNERLQNITRYSDLDFEVDEATNTAGISLYYENGTTPSNESISDLWPVDEAEGQYRDLSEKRYIRFLYPALGTDGKPVKGKYARPTEVGETFGGAAVVKVYAVVRDDNGAIVTRFQLAKFNLTFEEGTEPRPDVEIIGYATDAKESTYKSSRSPLALQRDYGTARASISFNPATFKPFITPPFGRTLLKSGEAGPGTIYDNSYGFPLDYDRSSYNFQPLLYQNDGENTWGSYTITKHMRVYWVGSSQTDYVPVRTLYKEAYPDAGYDDTNAAFMYIDASELPGTICSLEYSDQLCKGSRMYVSAWISSPDYFTYKSGGSTGRNVAPANVILTVKGVIQDNDGSNRREKVLYTYCPGPIFDVARAADGTTIERKAGERGIWQQVYFTFLNNDPDVENFHHYELTIDNACTTSDGGDILIDEVAVYSQKPEVMMEHTTPVCGQEVTLAKLSCDYESLIDQLELKENETPAGGEPYMWYCLLDKMDYDAALAGISRPTTQQVQQAFEKALVGDPQVASGEERAFRKVQFSTNYESFEPFSYEKALTQISDVWVSRETTSGGVRRMIISDRVANSKMRPRREYYLVFMPRSADAENVTLQNAVEAFQWGTDCCISSTFRTTSSVTFYDDNDSTMVDQDNRVQVCANQSINVSATLNGIKVNNGAPISFHSNNDWWLDYEGIPFTTAYINAAGLPEYVPDADKAPSSGAVSVKEALSAFRHFYPDATTLKDVEPRDDETAGIHFTDAMISGLREYMKAQCDYYDVAGNKVAKGAGAQLHLYSKTLNVTIAGDENTLQGTKSVITFVPIMPESTDEVIYCYEPIQFTIEVDGVAPSMLVGFREREDIYPSSYTSPVIRTGQDFLTSISTDSYVNPPTSMLRLPMRKIKTKSAAAVGVMKIQRDGVTFAPLYLVGTDDDAMNLYDPENNSSFRIVGVVHDIQASKEFSERAYADVYFLSDFKPHEGFTYTFRMGFVEKFTDGHDKTDEEAAVCDGSLTWCMQIVPKYVKWTASANGFAAKMDWTNDDNWARADRDDLHLDAVDTYVGNADNGTSRGFVPLGFTNVLVGQGSPYPFTPVLSERITNNRQLAADNSLTDFLAIERESSGSGVVSTATPDIEYDLIADDTGKQEHAEGCTLYNVRPFFTHQCHDIVLLDGGEIVHSEQLTHYNKVWKEYGLKAGRWYTLSSPFQRMYAGDWYAPTEGGRQLTPFFGSVTFDRTLHDRFAPAVFQRGWDKGKATVYYLKDGTGSVSQANVALQANWSAVYNDVQERYMQGGFSVKVNAEGRGHTYSDLLFRLPKEDAEYDYYSFDDQHVGTRQTVERTDGNATDLTGRLLTDALVSGTELVQTFTNKDRDNHIFLVGNPFPCGMDMNKFFDENKNVLGASGWKYWLLTEKGQTAVMRGPGAEGWLSVNSGSWTNGTLASGQGFFVEAPSDAVTTGADGSVSITLKFTADMMTSAAEAEVSLLSTFDGSVLPVTKAKAVKAEAPAANPVLRISADRGQWHSEAMVVKSASASRGYDKAEQMPLLCDDALRDVPMVYTVVDSAAVSVSHRRSIWRVPLGVASHSADSVRLTFTGMESFPETLSLLDEQTGRVTPLTLSSYRNGADGVSVVVPGITSGRYYLLTSEQPSAEDISDTDRPMVTVDGSAVCITSSAAHPLTSVHIVDVAGRELYRFAPFTSKVRMKLPFGSYVVEAASDAGTTVAKITVTE